MTAVTESPQEAGGRRENLLAPKIKLRLGWQFQNLFGKRHHGHPYALARLTWTLQGIRRRGRPGKTDLKEIAFLSAVPHEIT